MPSGGPWGELLVSWEVSIFAGEAKPPLEDGDRGTPLRVPGRDGDLEWISEGRLNCGVAVVYISRVPTGETGGGNGERVGGAIPGGELLVYHHQHCIHV